MAAAVRSASQCSADAESGSHAIVDRFIERRAIRAVAPAKCAPGFVIVLGARAAERAKRALSSGVPPALELKPEPIAEGIEE